MRVLVVGLGDIARKAYLPVLATRPDISLHLATRNRDVLHEVGRTFHAAGLYTDLDTAFASGRFDAVFVHAATEAHPAIVRRSLEQGIPTFVDKPLADTLAEVEAIVALAERRGTLLTMGFNRRFAPSYATLAGTGATQVVMEKHRHRQADTPRRVIYDDFIHVIDTLLFLAPGPVERTVIDAQVADGLLLSVALMLSGDGFTAIGTMNRDSGLNEERLDVIGKGVRRSVLNMSDRITSNGNACHDRRGDWTSVGRQRGFEAMCDDFLCAVREERPTSADQILATHALCERVTLYAEKGADAAR
ncbi:Gfo/Idh/MocA family protein [Sphingomonas sp. Leaf21]|uniref:Gfo/Idh/MocA family protein n=1 Tax=Sphingomonas sp. Leaf21 TaxID=2876550 RepID=UPI001E59BFC1|nr:Gfo/Idh/MocA family oxidoreductase [Sphingomonas sp. Leaf21]